MLKPAKAPNEAQRIELLHALNLLDTPPEQVFDRLTSLASHLLHVPTALVSLVDTDRQWFKSRVGMAATGTPRDVSFCGHAILQDDPLVVPDALSDERFLDNPIVVGGPKVRFYAGVPLRSLDGLPLGTLCVVDTNPRELSPFDLHTLVELAKLVEYEIRVRETAIIAKAQLDQYKQSLEVSEVRFRSVFERASVGITITAPDGSWLSVNDAFCDIVGYTREELSEISFQKITHPDDLEPDIVQLKRLVAGEIDRYQMEKRYIRKDGSPVWVSMRVAKKISDDGGLEYFIAIIANIQARKEAEEALDRLHHELEDRVEERTRELKQREFELRVVLESAYDAYVCVDETGLVTEWNGQAQKTFGWSAAEAIGQPLEVLIIPEPQRAAHRAGMARYLATRKSQIVNQRLEMPAIRKDGTCLIVEMTIRALDFDNKTVFSAFLHDISERKEIEAMREREARHDPLTGLLNRRGLMEMLPAAIARSDRSNTALCALFLDLDGFKQVNDDFGHDVGDLLLKEVSNRILGCLRKTDTVVRLAGDEFTVLLEGLKTGTTEAALFAQRIIEAIRRPIEIGSAVPEVGASIGIAVREPHESADPDELIRRADAAMYEAERAGKGRVAIDRR